MVVYNLLNLLSWSWINFLSHPSVLLAYCTILPGCNSGMQQACIPAGVQVQPDSESKPRQTAAACTLCHSGSKLTLKRKENYHHSFFLLLSSQPGCFHSLCQGVWTAGVHPDNWGEGGSRQTSGGCQAGSAAGRSVFQNPRGYLTLLYFTSFWTASL